MHWHLTPLALAISTSLIVSTNAWAEGGAAGNHGDILITPNEFNSGTPGTTYTAANGADGANFTNAITYTLSQSYTGTFLGEQGLNAANGDGGGGTGGIGGGSVLGAISYGGAGGNYTGANDIYANGGSGGAISGKSIIYSAPSPLTLTGISGGEGGKGGMKNDYAHGAGGAGGAGGAVVLGAYSQGGAGGYARSDAAVYSDGGAGGNISSITLTLSNLTLIGAPGGAGGQAGYAAGGSGARTDSGSSRGAGAVGAVGGGSVFAALSAGGAGGGTYAANSGPDQSLYSRADGGVGGDISDVTLILSDLTLTGALGGAGGQGAFGSGTGTGTGTGSGTGYGAGGAGGAGGGSIFAAFSQGGAGGSSQAIDTIANSSTPLAQGGKGGDISDVTLTLSNLTLTGGNGGAGGQAGYGIGTGTTSGRSNGSGSGAGGAGGTGGGSVFAAYSQGGAGGDATTTSYNATLSTVNGGAGGDISNVILTLNGAKLIGALGGAGGQAGYGAGTSLNMSSSKGYGAGAGGAGGAGGGSVIAAFSQGGAGGGYIGTSGDASANGGTGGNLTNTTLTLTNLTLTGALGGAGGQAGYGSGNVEDYGYGAGGAGGAGGGSVFGGFSQGGAGGFAQTNNTASAHGGAGGNVSDNTLSLSDVRILGAAGGAAGSGGTGTTVSAGAAGSKGIDGGSIFGGYSAGGAGGVAKYNSLQTSNSANGGRGGNTSNNSIRLAGTSTISGHIYGGYTQGGNAGTDIVAVLTSSSLSGLGGDAINNNVTLAGTSLNIGGSVYGGFSIDGNVDFATRGYAALNNSKTFTGNTLNLEGYRGSVEGVYNFENYNWTLPADVVNRDVLIEIRGNDLVDLNNTTHKVAMVSDGNRLYMNDEVVLINKAQGAHQPASIKIKQGYFVIYDAQLGINADNEFVLSIAGKEDSTPGTPRDLPAPAGRLNPTSKAFLEGRASALALVNQGADMVSNQLSTCATGLFLEGEGGRSQYKTGSHVKVNDAKLLLGGRACFDLPDTSKMALALFAEHGNGNYDSRNQFADFGKVSGHGDLRYTGAGVAMHVDVATTGTAVQAEPVLGTKNGLYVDAALRAGSVKSDFASNDLVDADGKRAEYNSKSTYASAGAGLGYAWVLDAQQQLDLYGRYTWSRIGSDSANVGADKLNLGADTSSRLRVGTRYSYAWTERLVPYAGVAYEYDFDGRISGKVFDMSIDKPELKGGSAMLEFGIRTAPISQEPGFKIDLGLQGFAGQRKGASGSLSFVYDF